MANPEVFASLGKPVPFREDVEGAPTPTPRVAAAPAPATPAIKPGVYDDTDGVYQYQVMDDGNIKILRSRRGGAGTIVKADTVAHDAIMKNIMSSRAKPAKVKGAAYDAEQAKLAKSTPSALSASSPAKRAPQPKAPKANVEAVSDEMEIEDIPAQPEQDAPEPESPYLLDDLYPDTLLDLPAGGAVGDHPNTKGQVKDLEKFLGGSPLPKQAIEKLVMGGMNPKQAEMMVGNIVGDIKKGIGRDNKGYAYGNDNTFTSWSSLQSLTALANTKIPGVAVPKPTVPKPEIRTPKPGDPAGEFGTSAWVQKTMADSRAESKYKAEQDRASSNQDLFMSLAHQALMRNGMSYEMAQQTVRKLAAGGDMASLQAIARGGK